MSDIEVPRYQKIDSCRIKENGKLTKILDLGVQSLTGVFPKNASDYVPAGPLELHWCEESGLVQLGHVYDASEMYGDNYGYRSGLNKLMVTHLQNKIHAIERMWPLKQGDVVVDIGANDGTGLGCYKTPGIKRIGIDPTAGKFRQYYEAGIDIVVDFFSAESYRKVSDKKAKVVTSISMFYDLEDPIQFARDIEEILEDDGIWHFEQSYLPSMVRTCAYDTVCHEHVEYYSLSSVKYIVEAAGFKIIDVVMNDVNGGSFAVTAAKNTSSLQPNKVPIRWFLEQEEKIGLNTLEYYEIFAEKVKNHRENLRQLIFSLLEDGKTICGYGASTKGNVLLQYCGLTGNEITAIAEVNEDKFGSYTPGSLIPILSEEEVRKMNPDYMLVLPWHFKNMIIQREQDYISKGGKFIFPCPEIEII